MNFQSITQAIGNNVTMFGTFNEVGGVSYTQNQKQVSKCIIVDDNGEKHTVRLYGTMPTPALLNTRQQFTLSSYQGTTQQGQPYTGYSGFWNDRAQVAPQGSPQTPPQPAQPTNYQQPTPQGKKEPDWEAISRGKVRHGVVCAYIQARFKPDTKEVERWVSYIMTGKDPNSIPDIDPEIQNNPKWVGNDPQPPTDDDIPF